MILDDVRWDNAGENSTMPWDDECNGVDAKHELYVMYAIQAVLGGVHGGADVLFCAANIPQAAFRKRENVFTRPPRDVMPNK